jgi:dynein heavy chain
MITLTWTSMNIDAYVSNVQLGLQKLKELVSTINDIVENRIEKNLKVVSKALLVDLPENASFTLSEFVSMQQQHIKSKSILLQGKNTEIRNAFNDLVGKILAFDIEDAIAPVASEDIEKLRKHYNHFVYQALLHSAKNSMNSLKKRMGSRSGMFILNSLNSLRPFFHVDVQLMPPRVSLSPSLDDIQECINQSAQAILSCYKTVFDWENVAEIESANEGKHNFFERITKDIELVRVALLLTGCIQGVRNTVAEYLDSFSKVRNFVFCF